MQAAWCPPLASSILRPHLSTLFLDLHTSLMPYTTAAFRWRSQTSSPACTLTAARYQLHNSIQHHHPTQAEHASPQHPTHSAPFLQQTHRPRREASGSAPSGALLLFFFFVLLVVHGVPEKMSREVERIHSCAAARRRMMSGSWSWGSKCCLWQETTSHILVQKNMTASRAPWLMHNSQSLQSRGEDTQGTREGWGILQSPHLLLISRSISLWIQRDWLSSPLRGL